MCVLTWVEGSYVAVVLMALVLLPWLSSVSAKQPYVYKQIQDVANSEFIVTEIRVRLDVEALTQPKGGVIGNVELLPSCL